MKLHHFTAAKVSESEKRIQDIGKALAPAKQPITEIKLTDIKKIEPLKKKIEVKKDGDITQQMRDYAVDQMEDSEHSAHLHRKIRHYD